LLVELRTIGDQTIQALKIGRSQKRIAGMTRLSSERSSSPQDSDLDKAM
jgi:hypothetical protein